MISFLVADEGEMDALSCSVSPMVKDAVEGLTDTDSTRTSCSFRVHAKRRGRVIRRRLTSLFMVLWLKSCANITKKQDSRLCVL